MVGNPGMLGSFLFCFVLLVLPELSRTETEDLENPDSPSSPIFSKPLD